ncbi:Hypothetical predicted protein [Paramuricea clavata]|uniref:Uncharacterized protein n=1 Tax=Paramuricea clavata TaxID=317549 RepID=A0A7D9J5W7_PARCT|nr:Hypothetical predicted protein [Paramuricea clavata]
MLGREEKRQYIRDEQAGETGRRSSAACGCMKDNLPCTTMCQCQGCTNNQEQDLPEDEIDDSGSEQEDDELMMDDE